MKNKGFTLIEMVLVVAIFSAIFAAMMALMTHSQTYLSRGQNKVREQQEARRLMETITRNMRDANPAWNINGTYYNLSISANNTNLTFYQPVFNNTTNNVTSVRRITYRRSTFYPNVLRQKIGSAASNNLTAELHAVNFTGSSDGGATWACTSACDMVRIRLEMIKKQMDFNKTTPFVLVNEVTLRNREMAVSNETAVESSEEGEF